MRVLLLTDRLSARGGADAHLRELAAELVRAGLEVELAVGRVDEGASPPCRVHLLEGLLDRGARPVALETLVCALRPDLLHVQNVMNPEALEWIAAGGVPALCTVQDHRVFCPGRGKWTLGAPSRTRLAEPVPGAPSGSRRAATCTAAGAVCREPMSRSQCAGCFDDGAYFDSVFSLTEARLRAVRRLPCVVLSRYMARELEAVGVPASRLRCIPPLVSAPAPAAPQGEPCVAFASRLVAAKGVVDAVEIWRRAAVALPLVIAGAGPERGRLQRQPGVELAGWLDRAELGRLLARARALLLPSRWQEPFGIVGAEALAAGVPVVAWRSGGVEEWHPGPLCEWGDVDGMAGALREAIGRRAAPAAGLERARLMGALLALYGEVTG